MQSRVNSLRQWRDEDHQTENGEWELPSIPLSDIFPLFRFCLWMCLVAPHSHLAPCETWPTSWFVPFASKKFCQKSADLEPPAVCTCSTGNAFGCLAIPRDPERQLPCQDKTANSQQDTRTHTHIIYIIILYNIYFCIIRVCVCTGEKGEWEISVEREGEREGEHFWIATNCTTDFLSAFTSLFKLLYQHYRLHPHFPQEMVPSQSGLPGMQ